jgi:hypothetical protein
MPQVLKAVLSDLIRDVKRQVYLVKRTFQGHEVTLKLYVFKQ